jgi:hypothetical protein
MYVHGPWLWRLLCVGYRSLARHATAFWKGLRRADGWDWSAFWRPKRPRAGPRIRYESVETRGVSRGGAPAAGSFLDFLDVFRGVINHQSFRFKQRSLGLK